MDRARQLGNVSFGGDWAERITVREAVQAQLEILRAAVASSAEEDPAAGPVVAALHAITEKRARRALIRDAWLRAARIHDQGLRQLELARVLGIIEGVVGSDV